MHACRSTLEDPTNLALFGISLGGAVALATAARRDDIDAVVADSVFADYAQAAVTHGWQIGAPLPSLTPLAIRWAERRAGARFADVRPPDMLGACRCLVMLIHGDADPFVQEPDIAQLVDALRGRANELDVHLTIADAGHCLAIVADAPNYTDRLRLFLDAAIASRKSVTSSDGSTIHG